MVDLINSYQIPGYKLRFSWKVMGNSECIRQQFLFERQFVSFSTFFLLAKNNMIGVAASVMTAHRSVKSIRVFLKETLFVLRIQVTL